MPLKASKSDAERPVDHFTWFKVLNREISKLVSALQLHLLTDSGIRGSFLVSCRFLALGAQISLNPPKSNTE
jgi:hypothetical protein